MEPEIAEPRLVSEVCGRDALVDPAREELAEISLLSLRQLGVQKRLEPVERQVQRVQQQVGSFVVGLVAAVAEVELCLAEARYGLAQPVAQRLQFADGDGTHASTRVRIPR